MVRGQVGVSGVKVLRGLVLTGHEQENGRTVAKTGKTVRDNVATVWLFVPVYPAANGTTVDLSAVPKNTETVVSTVDRLTRERGSAYPRFDGVVYCGETTVPNSPRTSTIPDYHKHKNTI